MKNNEREINKAFASLSDITENLVTILEELDKEFGKVHLNIKTLRACLNMRMAYLIEHELKDLDPRGGKNEDLIST